MSRQIICTNNAPPSTATHSQAVNGAGLTFVSGTGPFELGSRAVKRDAIQKQTHQCLSNISAILAAAGSSLDRVVSATVILLEESGFPGMNEEWLKWFPTDPPARQAAKRPARILGLRVSIAVVAEA